MFYIAFLYLQFVSVIFWQKEIGKKADYKMLVKLTSLGDQQFHKSLICHKRTWWSDSRLGWKTIPFLILSLRNGFTNWKTRTIGKLSHKIDNRNVYKKQFRKGWEHVWISSVILSTHAHNIPVHPWASADFFPGEGKIFQGGKNILFA